MISTEQEARAAVAKVGPDALGVVDLFANAPIIGFAKWCPGAILETARIYDAQRRPRKAARLRRIATEWAAARGAAR